MAEARFTLDDFLTQMREVKKLGPLQDLLAMLPGIPGGKHAAEGPPGGRGRARPRTEAIICSMTQRGAAEPRYHQRQPAPADRRAARATTTQQVNALLKEFAQASG